MTVLAALAAAVRERLVAGAPAALPGFGTLARHHVPARVQTRPDGGRVLLPPSETIRFSQDASDPAAVAAALALAQGLPADGAAPALRDAVDQLEAIVVATGEARLPGVGLFRRTSSRVLFAADPALLTEVNRPYAGLRPVEAAPAPPPPSETPSEFEAPPESETPPAAEPEVAAEPEPYAPPPAPPPSVEAIRSALAESGEADLGEASPEPPAADIDPWDLGAAGPADEPNPYAPPSTLPGRPDLADEAAPADVAPEVSPPSESHPAEAAPDEAAPDEALAEEAAPDDAPSEGEARPAETIVLSGAARLPATLTLGAPVDRPDPHAAPPASEAETGVMPDTDETETALPPADADSTQAFGEVESLPVTEPDAESEPPDATTLPEAAPSDDAADPARVPAPATDEGGAIPSVSTPPYPPPVTSSFAPEPESAELSGAEADAETAVAPDDGEATTDGVSPDDAPTADARTEATLGADAPAAVKLPADDAPAPVDVADLASPADGAPIALGDDLDDADFPEADLVPAAAPAMPLDTFPTEAEDTAPPPDATPSPLVDELFPSSEGPEPWDDLGAASASATAAGLGLGAPDLPRPVSVRPPGPGERPADEVPVGKAPVAPALAVTPAPAPRLGAGSLLLLAVSIGAIAAAMLWPRLTGPPARPEPTTGGGAFGDTLGDAAVSALRDTVAALPPSDTTRAAVAADTVSGASAPATPLPDDGGTEPATPRRTLGVAPPSGTAILPPRVAGLDAARTEALASRDGLALGAGTTWVVLSTASRDEAARLVTRYRQSGYRTGVIASTAAGRTTFRVGVGQFASRDDALALRDRLPPQAPADTWPLDLSSRGLSL